MGSSLFVKLPLQLLDVALMRGAALDELGTVLLPLFFSVLQPRLQVLQVSAALREKLFGLVLSGEGALERSEPDDVAKGTPLMTVTHNLFIVRPPVDYRGRPVGVYSAIDSARDEIFVLEDLDGQAFSP